jgi:hypothetical protein
VGWLNCQIGGMHMTKIISEYYIENGRLYCKDNVFDAPYEVECSVGMFLELLRMEESIC